MKHSQNECKKSEEESFFDVDEMDQIFSSWADLLGVSDDGNKDEAEWEEEADETDSTTHRVNAKEACNLM